MNQKFKFVYKDGKVQVKAGVGFYTKVDLGIENIILNLAPTSQSSGAKITPDSSVKSNINYNKRARAFKTNFPPLFFFGNIYRGNVVDIKSVRVNYPLVIIIGGLF